MKPIAIVAIFLVFFSGAFERLDAYTIDFEGLLELTDVTSQYGSAEHDFFWWNYTADQLFTQ